MQNNTVLVISSEHASNFIPSNYREHFPKASGVFKTQAAFDEGASYLSKQLAMYLGCPLFLGNVSRLIIDLNHTIDSRRLFSKYTKELKIHERQILINRYYRPYVNGILQTIQNYQSKKLRVCHISIHTFSLENARSKAPCDMGIIYDSKRKDEKHFADELAKNLESLDPSIIIKHNYPFKGCTKGITNYFRLIFSETRYLGIELQINYELMHNPTDKKWIRTMLQASLGDFFTDSWE